VPCNQPDFDIQTVPLLPPGVPGGGVKDPKSPFLIVSNAPEKVGETEEPLTLYKTSIPISDDPNLKVVQRIRLYVWHEADPAVNTDCTFGFEVRMMDGQATIKNIAQITLTGDIANLKVAGMCLAKAQLFGSLDPVRRTYSVGPDPVMLWSHTVAPSKVAGAVYEFDVEVLGVGTLDVRTYATRSDETGSFDDPVVPVNQHVRGWWPYSEITVAAVRKFNPQVESPLPVSVCESLGPEHAPDAFGKLSGTSHQYDRANKGCYGANLNYEITLENESVTTATLVVPYIKARNTGHAYWGAAQTGLSAGKGIVRLPLNGQDLDQNNAISPSNGVGTTLNPGEKKIMLIRIADGGAATLPVSLHLQLGG